MTNGITSQTRHHLRPLSLDGGRSWRGIGRLDGHPNRDLNVGAIIALSPAITPAQKAVYSSWGAGRYDPRFNIDGKNTPLVLPPAYGLSAVKNETYTAEGPISYWNAYVAVTQMHGHGNLGSTPGHLDYPTA